MSKRTPQKGSASGRLQDRGSRNSQAQLFARLGVTNATVQGTILDLLREIYDAGSGDLRSKVHRNKVRQAIRDGMDRMPDAIQNQSQSRDSVVDILYAMFKLLQARWKKQGISKSSKQPQPPAHSENIQPPTSTFDHAGPSAVPDADVQIITHDNPGQPLPIRLSDLLPDSNDLTNRSLNGDWVNASAIRLDVMRQDLVNEGYIAEGATLWWSPHALNDIDQTQLDTPQEGETRPTSINLGSNVIRTITTYYPSHRNPSPDNADGSPRSPLPRPSFTIIIRPPAVTGGALVSQQPDLARPGTTRRGSLKTSPGSSRVPPRTEETGDLGAHRQLVKFLALDEMLQSALYHLQSPPNPQFLLPLLLLQFLLFPLPLFLGLLEGPFLENVIRPPWPGIPPGWISPFHNRPLML